MTTFRANMNSITTSNIIFRFTLSNNKYKLTESEIAIATAKGWTVE